MTLPGFMCRKHTITRCKDHPLQKVDAIYSLPPPSDEREAKSYAVWTWAKQDSERQFSIMDARKGTFNLAEMCVSGGRVRAMSVTHQGDMRAWVSTVVSPMKGVWPGGHEGVGQYRGESYERGVARRTCGRGSVPW